MHTHISSWNNLSKIGRKEMEIRRRKSSLKRPIEKEWTTDNALGKLEPPPDSKAEEAQAMKVGATTSEKSGKQLNVMGGPKGKRKRNDKEDDDDEKKLPQAYQAHPIH